MKRRAIAAALSLAAFSCPFPAGADSERLVSFEGGIGSQPLRSGPAPNVARGVNPGGIPWVIERLRADVRTDGSIKVDGRGLLLAGGNNIGTNGGQSVHARLFCGGTAPDFATATVHNSATVPLDPDGDFRIESDLTGTLPATCNNPVLLIVSGASGGGGSWFAAGIPRR